MVKFFKETEELGGRRCLKRLQLYAATIFMNLQKNDNK